MPDEVVRIERPLVIVFEDEGDVVCHIHPSERAKSHREFGLLVCDLVRHVARTFESRRTTSGSGSTRSAGARRRRSPGRRENAV
jgi:hypothetical protein